MNQQLIDYIKQQLQLGVAKEAIKTTLQTSGWPEADIAAAMNSIAPASQPAATATPASVQPVSSAQPVAAAVQAKPVTIATNIAPASVATAVQPRTVTSDIFQPKVEVTVQKVDPVQPKTEASPAKTEIKIEQKPEIKVQMKDMKADPVFQPKVSPMASARPSSTFVPTETVRSSSKGGLILTIILSLLLLGAVGGGAYLYLQNSGLKSQLSAATESLAAQGGTLKTQTDNATQELNSTKDQVRDLLTQISFYATPVAGTALVDEPVSVKGVLGGGDKLPYTLTTQEQMVISVKNSKDAKFVEVAKPLLGTLVQMSGSRIMGSKEITVKTVNGSSVEVPAAPVSAATTTATTTPAVVGPKSTSTTSTPPAPTPAP